ncbi:unnamed protein product [Brassica napus]|uniref:(rape) hypothetical protein n=1 Tax=Brassica napus TaxID=3708 RepID=A0A816IK36_BRANA|nr:unnamed protein product [Brassica napus]
MIELVRMMGDYEIEPKLSYLTTPFDFDQANPMSFYEGSWCGCFWSGQNKIPIAAASKGNCEGALPKRWQRFKNKMEMISRRVLKETDFSCSDGIAQNKARSCFVCYIFFLLLL